MDGLWGKQKHPTSNRMLWMVCGQRKITQQEIDGCVCPMGKGKMPNNTNSTQGVRG